MFKFWQIETKLDAILANQALILAALKQENVSMAALDDKIAALTADVANETTVTTSAVKLVQGIPALISAAVAQALAAGATPAQLASLDALGQSINANAASLAAAVTANTPPTPAPTPSPTPAGN